MPNLNLETVKYFWKLKKKIAFLESTIFPAMKIVSVENIFTKILIDRVKMVIVYRKNGKNSNLLFRIVIITILVLIITKFVTRMRKRVVRNDLFYCFYPYREEDDCKDSDKPHKYKKPSSHDSKLWYERHR